jgi:ethanolamine utilization protein EutJ
VIGVARDVDRFLLDAAEVHRSPAADWNGPLRFGVDLGTATIVVAVVDADQRPVYVDAVRRDVVRDGVVVDFQGAVDAVRELVARATAALGEAPESAGTAYPPGVAEADARACRFVLDQAGVPCDRLVDEVSAAQILIGLENGAIADIGGGSTGVGTWVDGKMRSLDDRPGGGHHLNLILAGALGVEIQAAEREKHDRPEHYLPVLRPGIERIAHNIAQLIPPSLEGPVHLVGGALMLPGAGQIVESYLGRSVVEHPHSMLVTPFGIACSR